MTDRVLLYASSRRDGGARLGEIATPRGIIRTPAFMPVGTAATVKAVYTDQVEAAGADIILANTYHLMLRPGAERVARLGGLHSFMRWRQADPDRQRRLPGDEPVQAAQDHRRGRHLPIAHRRLDARAHAGAGDRDPMPAGRRHPDAARRVRGAARNAGRNAHGRACGRSPGRSVARRHLRDTATMVSPARARLCSASCKVEPMRDCGSDRPKASSRWIFRATPSAVSPSASRRK